MCAMQPIDRDQHSSRSPLDCVIACGDAVSHTVRLGVAGRILAGLLLKILIGNVHREGFWRRSSHTVPTCNGHALPPCHGLSEYLAEIRAEREYSFSPPFKARLKSGAAWLQMWVQSWSLQ